MCFQEMFVAVGLTTNLKSIRRGEGQLVKYFQSEIPKKIELTFLTEGNSNRSQAGGRGLTGLKFGHTFKTLIRYLSGATEQAIGMPGSGLQRCVSNTHCHAEGKLDED